MLMKSSGLNRIYRLLVVFILYLSCNVKNLNKKKISLMEAEKLNLKKDLTTGLLSSLSASKAQEAENTVISPLSIFQILSLTANGAAGETSNEILNTIHNQVSSLKTVNSENKSIISLLKTSESTKIANAIFTKAEIKEDFQKFAEEQYQASVDKLISSEQVNKWCSDKTEGKITKILNKLPDDLRMILINALYFKGEWVHQFKKSSTSEKDFQGINNQTHKVDMMSQSLKHILYYEDEQVQVISLPYKDFQTSALIILPRGSLDTYFPSFSESLLGEYFNKLNSQYVNLHLPKFKTEYEVSLKSALKSLGIKMAFDANADFSLLSQETLYVGDVLHKTFLSVDENGTEAAAATAVMMLLGSSMHQPKNIEMNVNRPFMFVLKNQQIAQPLIVAKIYKP